MQEKKLPIFSDVEILADSGYQGLQKEHKKTILPIKKRNSKLTLQECIQNKTLSQKRIVVENVIRTLKVFRILKETYRDRHSRFGLRIILIAGIVNKNNGFKVMEGVYYL